MRVAWLSLTDFRSYRELGWEPDPGVNLLLGPNGAGKTNLLEAVAFLGSLRSFRSAPDEAMVGDGAAAAVLRGGIAGPAGERLVEVEMPRDGRRRVQVDKDRLRRATDLLGVLRVIAFLPEDLDLVKRGPAYRRDLLDEVAVQLWPAAHGEQTEFERALRQRNAFLKAGEDDPVTLGVWDARLAQSGGRLVARRLRVIDALSSHLEKAYAEIAATGEQATFGYESSWGSVAGGSAAELSDRLSTALAGRARVDRDRRMTTVGPHRDEPVFYLDGVESRTHASQGEQRTMALAVKLAAHRAVAELIDEPPVLLLDDVFSELDPDRAAALSGALPGDTQTIISSARPEDVPISGRVWRVGEGRVI